MNQNPQPRGALQIPGILTFLLLLVLSVSESRAQVNLAIDTGTTYQTIRGWGCVNSIPDYLTPEFRQQLITEVVNEYGLNRLRIEIPAGNKVDVRRWEWLNDNTDPQTTDWSSMNLAAMDENLQSFVLPFVDQVRANGEPFDSYLSFSFYDTGSSGAPPAWLLNNPGEYAEFSLSLLQRLKYFYGIDVTYQCILNEASYNNVFSLSVVRDMIKALCPKMEAAGLETKLAFPESVSIDTAYNNFITPTATDDELWSWVGAVSYHRYGGTTQLANLAAFAGTKGLPTSFTETGTISTDVLYSDLTVGMVSHWEVYSLGSAIVFNDQHFNYFETGNGSNGAGGFYWRLRQVMHYVRPGAVRVRVTTDDVATGAKQLAWLHNGKTTLNFWGFTGSTVNISGLTPGTYGLSSARLTAAYVERGVKTVGAGGTLSLTGLDSAAMYTLYPRNAGNLPPVFTSFKPSVSHLSLPTSSFTLTAAAQDPDLNTLSYQWTVTKVPVGASVSLATPNAASCAASGLTVAGDYTFTVTASDGTASTQRQVFMRVFAGNPAPLIWTMQNRIPVQIVLPLQTSTTLRSSVWNVDNDTLTLQWIVQSQPPGANAQFATPTENDTTVSGMTVAGDYVFRLTVSDGTNVVSRDHTVPVYPANITPTVSAAANPTTLTLPTATTQLTSTSADADGDPLTHWWKVISAPIGASPQFSTQTAANTAVTGMIVPGTYSFQHVVTDQFSFKASSNVSVTVAAGSSPELFSLTTPNGGESYEPGQTVRIRWSSANFSGNVKLEFYNGSTWSVISASTANDGIEPWVVPPTQYSGCKVRVSDAVDGLPSDESDAIFRIIGPDLNKILKIEGNFATGPTLEWSSLPGGYSYQIHYSDTLLPGDWHPVGSPQVAQTGQFRLVYTDTSATGVLKRFYKVVETPLE
jgi:hypothetical protein